MGRVRRVLRGAAWDELGAAPLCAPAVGAVDGALLLAVNGVRLRRDLAPEVATALFGKRPMSALAFAALYSLAALARQQAVANALRATMEMEPAQQICPPGCHLRLESVMHGDPMFKVNGQGVHFWVKEGSLQQLMTWKDPKTGSLVSIEGKTFGHPTTNHQWFDEFRLKRGTDTVARFYMEKGKMVAKSSGAPVPQDGDAEITLGGLKMRIFHAVAAKFNDPAERSKYAHINIDFGTNLPASASGTFADFAGIKPMSEATKAALKPAALANSTVLSEKSSCLCPPPPPAPPSLLATDFQKNAAEEQHLVLGVTETSCAQQQHNLDLLSQLQRACEAYPSLHIVLNVFDAPPSTNVGHTCGLDELPACVLQVTNVSGHKSMFWAHEITPHFVEAGAYELVFAFDNDMEIGRFDLARAASSMLASTVSMAQPLVSIAEGHDSCPTAANALWSTRDGMEDRFKNLSSSNPLATGCEVQQITYVENQAPILTKAAWAVVHSKLLSKLPPELFAHNNWGISDVWCPLLAHELPGNVPCAVLAANLTTTNQCTIEQSADASAMREGSNTTLPWIKQHYSSAWEGYKHAGIQRTGCVLHATGELLGERPYSFVKAPMSTETKPVALHIQRQAGLLHSAKQRVKELPPQVFSFGLASDAAIGGGSSQSATEHIGLYRILGNPLPPRHDEGQLLRNLEFLLEHEPPLPGAAKIFVLNRLENTTNAMVVKQMITGAGHTWIEAPLELGKYKRFAQLSTFGMPDGTPGGWARLPDDLGKWYSRRDTNLFLMNNNGARNFALDDGVRRGFGWVLPFDGNCFFSEQEWRTLRDGLQRAEGSRHTYVTLPLIRTDIVPPEQRQGDDRIWRVPADITPGEPQIAFHRTAKLRFDPSVFYGRRPKVELLWRLGVEGVWDQYKCFGFEVTHSAVPVCPNTSSPVVYGETVLAWKAHPELGEICSCGVSKDPQESQRVLDLTDPASPQIGVLRLPDGDEESASQSGDALKLRGELRVEAVVRQIDAYDRKSEILASRAPVKPVFFNLAAMEHTRRAWLVGFQDNATRQVDELLQLAESRLDSPLLSVTDKTRSYNEEASKRDYQSIGLYDWQLKELSSAQLEQVSSEEHWTADDGSDWVKWDGHVRPGGDAGRGDRARTEDAHSNLTLFALASFYSNDPRYSVKAAAIARHWWLDNRTGVLPRMTFAEADRAESKRSSGVIEMRSIAMALDAIALLHATTAWTADDANALSAWCAEYASWLARSEEQHAQNNHRWWYAVQLSAVQHCANQPLASNDTLWRNAQAAALAVEGATGLMPEEQVRSRAVHYHVFTASALNLLWRACENAGLFEAADAVKPKLAATVGLLARRGADPSALQELSDEDHFTWPQIRERMTLLCQWLTDVYGSRETEETQRALDAARHGCDGAAPALLPSEYMDSGAWPFANLVF